MLKSDLVKLVQTGRNFQMLFFLTIFALVALAYYFARKGRVPELRPIEALDAIREHVGRAAELGTPIYSGVGMGGMALVTLAGLSVLGEVTARAAEVGIETYTSTMDFSTTVVAEVIMRQGLTAGGKPEWYAPGKYVKWYGYEYFTFSSGTAGLLMEVKPAVCIYIGSFTNELTQILETGARIGAVQIGGLSGSGYSVPMALFADYLALGTEQFAIGASISKDPLSIATLAGEDWVKVIIIAIALVGMVAFAAGNRAIYSLLSW